MDIKNRLNLNHISKPEVPHAVLVQDLGENTAESALFDENEIVLGIITEKINSGANIVYVCPQNCSKKTVALLLKNYVRRNIPVSFPVSELEYVPGNINFIPEASGEDLKNIVEAVLKGISSFVAGISLNSYKNVAEKLETLIAVNSGISEKYIKFLLKEFAPIFINIEEENGVFSVKSIDKTVFKDSSVEIKNLYSYFSGIKSENEDKGKENSMLPDFKSILEESAENKANSVDSELIVNNPALKKSTNKFAIAEATTKPLLQPEIAEEKKTSKSENMVIADFIENSKESVKVIESQQSVKQEVPEEKKENIKENIEPGIIPSIKNILEDDSDGGEKELLTEVKKENDLSGEHIIMPEEKEVESKKIELETAQEESPENIDINIPAQATPVNKYKALRDKIRNKKEQETSV